LTLAPNSSAALSASIDWQSCPIGSPATWPAALRNIVDVMFEMPNPAFIVWGTQDTLLYNEPFRASVDIEAAETFGRPLALASRCSPRTLHDW
jgi:hypothetical protein